MRVVFVRDGEVVAPGEPICVQEEFNPGENSALDKSGIIFSRVLGRVSYDRSRRKVYVKPLREPEIIKVGDEVLGQVKGVQDKIAVVNVLSINRRALKHPRTAVILPGKRIVGREMRAVVGVGDLVVAQVVTSFMGVIGLSIRKPNLGVILGICDKCSEVLKKARGGLVCPKCGEKHKRKIVPYYGNLERLASMLEVRMG